MRNHRRTLTSILLLLAATFVASPTLARTTSARAGGSFRGTEVNCFQDNESGMTNICGGLRWYDIGLTFDTAGSKTINVFGSASLTTCLFVDIANNGVERTPPGAGLPMPVVAGQPGHLAVTFPSVGFGDYGKVECFLPAGGKIFGVDYTQ